MTYLPAIQRAPHSAKRSSAARCWAGDEYQSLAVLNWLDWFMAVGVGKLRPSLDPTRSAASFIWVEGITPTCSRAPRPCGAT